MKFSTPVLFLIFNRPELTEKVFEVIKKLKPLNLYISADGPRNFVDGEELLCFQARKSVLENIDWDCNVHTLFRDTNFGCGISVSGAIDWFFSQVEEGIILEDDCLPSISFFYFCSDLLSRYREDERFFHIGGSNLMKNTQNNTTDYFFSKLTHVWGWATWRRAWNKYSFNIPRNVNEVRSVMNNVYSQKYIINYWVILFSNFSSSAQNTWDYQWQYTVFKYNGIAIIPRLNLIANIGFNSNATHTLDSNSRLSNLKIFDISLNSHPSLNSIKFKSDKYIMANAYRVYNPLKLILVKLIRVSIHIFFGSTK